MINKIFVQCSHCGYHFEVSPMLGIAEGMYYNGYRAVGDAVYCPDCVKTWKDRNGEKKENTEWHNIVVWRNSADVVEKYVKKGSQLYVEGKLTTRKWTDQSGNVRYTTEIQAQSIQLLGRKEDSITRPSYDQEPI